jgi:hypothetical protein
MLKPTRELAKKIIANSTKSDVINETNELKKKFNALLRERIPPHLTALEFDEIVKWKLDKQYHRSKEQRSINTDSVIVPITTACFAIKSVDSDYQIELQLKQLSTIRGIALPLASAILAICFPTKYVVIDSVLWESIFGEEKSSFTINDYLKFIGFIKALALHTEMPLQDTEHLLWLYTQNL